VEPRQHEHVLARTKVAHRLQDVGLEHDPRVRRAFEALLRCFLRVGEGRLDVADGAQRVRALGDVVVDEVIVRVFAGAEGQAPRRSANSEPSSRTPSRRQAPR
jgi:hypothetical protein